MAEYLRSRQRESSKVSLWLVGLHAFVCGALIFVALSAPTIQLNHHLVANKETYVAAAMGVLVMIGVNATVYRLGLRMLRPATMIPIVIGVGALLRSAAPAIDATQSARPVAQAILSFSHEAVPVALFHTTRQLEYGLGFYLNRPAQPYESGQVPRVGHVLVAGQCVADQDRVPAVAVERPVGLVGNLQEIDAVAGIEALSWDTEHFGIGCARLTPVCLAPELSPPGARGGHASAGATA